MTGRRAAGGPGDGPPAGPPAPAPAPDPAPPPAPAAAPAAPRARLTAGDLLYASAMLLSTLWAVVLLFVVYPQEPADAAAAAGAEDVPVMSLQGHVVTVKRAALKEALDSGRYLPASQEQVDLFEAQRAATLKAVRRDRLLWFSASAAFPGVGLLLFRLWWRARRRDG